MDSLSAVGQKEKKKQRKEEPYIIKVGTKPLSYGIGREMEAVEEPT